MLTRHEAEKLLEEIEPKIKECVLAAADLDRAVGDNTRFHASYWNEWFVRGRKEASLLIRKWGLLRERNRDVFATVLEGLQDKGEDVCLLLNELKQKAVLQSLFSFEDMMTGIRFLESNPDRWYLECQFGSDDKDQDAMENVRWAVWEKVGCFRPHHPSEPHHTLGLTEIIELREALERFYRVVYSSSLEDAFRAYKETSDYDRHEFLLSAFPSTDIRPLMCDILLDFSPSAISSLLGGEDKVKEVVRDFAIALKNFEEDIAKVKEKPRASTEKKSRGVAAAACGIGAIAR